MGPQRNARQSTWPTAQEIANAYSRISFPSSGSGSNSVPVATPDQVEARRLLSAQATTGHPYPRGRGGGGRRGRGRGRGGGGGKYMDVGGFRVLAPPLPPVQGMPMEKNQELAEQLRGMLEDDGLDETKVSYEVLYLLLAETLDWHERSHSSRSYGRACRDAPESVSTRRLDASRSF
jgi:hypothetical protein